MVARKFFVSHEDQTYELDYDFDNGLEVFKFQLFSLTSIPPDEQKILGGNNDLIVSDDSDLNLVSDNLRLVKITEGDNDKQDEEAATTSGGQLTADLVKSDEEFARLLQAEEEALMLQEYVAEQDNGRMEARIRPYISQVLMYEDPMRQERARKTVPIEELEEKTLVSLAKEGNFKPSQVEKDHAFLLQLLFWFKQSFSWVHAPPCEGCGAATVNQGMGTALPSELQYGGNRVELYRCSLCSRTTRFPRYNDPLKLLETRRGRCGEWANCFTLYCRTFGYESRLILDFTDHVWTECFSQSLGRWMHLDPCEAVYDKPLLYEKGWGKKLNYTIAIAKDGVYDVTKRYTRKWHEILTRRNITTESSLVAVLNNITKERRGRLAPEVLALLEDRDKNEQEELENNLHSSDDASISLPGRRSGDEKWRISRSEFGSDSNCSLSSSSCPVRTCVDEHVTQIYNAFSPVLTQFMENNLPTSRAIEILGIFRGVLVDLKNSPYKTRNAYLKLDLDGAQTFFNQLLPSLQDLLSAISLKRELDSDGKVKICLAGDPVKTSLALPVALDTIDELTCNLKKYEILNKDSISLPLLKLNRICSGSVLASGEELPFGIATSAFDGIQASKWEEPNGARGCWIMYKSLDHQVHELAAYELMSANDAPERDPKDWVVEGSNDGGCNWHLLDKQSSQLFESRFQRKLYKITSTAVPSNLFRFRVLAVRNGASNSRMQIGSIDMFAKNN